MKTEKTSFFKCFHKVRMLTTTTDERKLSISKICMEREQNLDGKSKTRATNCTNFDSRKVVNFEECCEN